MKRLQRIQDCEIGQGSEYISDFLGYRNVGHGVEITSSRLRITDTLCQAMLKAVNSVYDRLYNKQFICVAKQVRHTWIVPRDAHGKSTEGTETQMVFIYHHDCTDYLVNVTHSGPATD